MANTFRELTFGGMAVGQVHAREQQIVEALAARDQTALSLIYEHYADTLYGNILRIVRSEAVAQDVLQDAMVKVWKHSARYDAKQGRLFTWLLNICRNTAIDAYRSKGFRQQSENQGLDIAVDRVGQETNTDTIGLSELLDQLDENHQVLIRKAYFEGMTQAELADELQLPLGTVKTRMRAALGKLRGHFEASDRVASGNLMLFLRWVDIAAMNFSAVAPNATAVKNDRLSG